MGFIARQERRSEAHQKEHDDGEYGEYAAHRFSLGEAYSGYLLRNKT